MSSILPCREGHRDRLLPLGMHIARLRRGQELRNIACATICSRVLESPGGSLPTTLTNFWSESLSPLLFQDSCSCNEALFSSQSRTDKLLVLPCGSYLRSIPSLVSEPFCIGIHLKSNPSALDCGRLRMERLLCHSWLSTTVKPAIIPDPLHP